MPPMRRPSARRVLVCLAAAGALLLGRDAAAGAAEAAQKPTVRRSEKGLNFDLPADWPIEERNGVVGPVPVEEYLGAKLGAMEMRLQAMEQQLGGLDVRMRVLEEAIKRQTPGLKSSERPAGAP